ncbi:MarR family winged helix-turn-helix transcriptional regulator [Abyssisolibacter fermentans]|uniref:MarR family winged helix-turn-helix transcriptional regulator n=1 Tax=Abyssisolibacter fermentans TaxID=1766203 RepID=UPI0008304D6A|nr:MarR family transcriptional regulator [Abyssisolibacter fermentans]
MRREEIGEYILNILPMFHRKLFKGVFKKESMRHIQLVSMVNKNDGKPMKFYCKNLMISKPNLSKMVNKAIEEGLIERENDEKDRRIIKLFITEKGKEIIEIRKQDIKKAISNNLKGLNDDDIIKLQKNFEEIQVIFDKL